jgi:predicted HicB family RNase H-like nuclease
VDDYLALCAKRGKEPEKPFKGSFNVRVGPELHRRLALAAAKRGMSLNRLVAETLEEVG